MAIENRSSSSGGGTLVITIILVVAALRYARDVFLPLALAILISFLLSPLVTLFRRGHLGRVPSVFIAVIIACAFLAALGSFMTGQFEELATKLPVYQQNVHKKVQSVAKASGGLVGKMFTYEENLRKELEHSGGQTNAPSPGQEEKTTRNEPVEVRSSPFSPLGIVRAILGSLFNILAMMFIVTVFVIFMLMERDDLRIRLSRLIGAGEPQAPTTQLVDEAAYRVSRYLLMQFIVNATYAIPVALGLYFIGIPNPILWGVLAGLLRYIPYIGAWIAMLMPFTLALAVDPAWTKPLLVLGLFGVIELIVANAVEPWVYGSSTGITPLAVLVAAVFWTWVWGPVGLLLSTPLTVCMVSFGRYLPSLGFLTVLFGDEPADAALPSNGKSGSKSDSA